MFSRIGFHILNNNKITTVSQTSFQTKHSDNNKQDLLLHLQK